MHESNRHSSSSGSSPPQDISNAEFFNGVEFILKGRQLLSMAASVGYWNPPPVPLPLYILDDLNLMHPRLWDIT